MSAVKKSDVREKPGGGPLCNLVSDDVAKNNAAEQELQQVHKRLSFETLLAEISARLINLPAGEIDRQIEEAQRLVCDALGLDVSSLWQWRPDNPVMHTLTHYYRPLGGPPVPQTMKGQDYFPWCQRRVLEGKVVAISSLADFPEEAARDRETFNFYGLKTTLTIPLSVGGGPVFGSVNFNDMRAERRWSEALVQRLQLVAQIFANALARKVADQALRESEARYRGIFDNAIEGLFRTSVEGKLLVANAALARMLGYGSAGEAMHDIENTGRQVWADPDERMRFMQRLADEGSLHAYECQFKRKDGTRFWVSLSTQAVRGPDGRMAYFDGFVEDITDRRQAEQALAETELRYRLLFEAIPESVLLIGTDGRVIAANPASARLYGYESAKQLEGFYTPLLIAEKDRARATRTQATVIQGEERPTRRYTEVRRDGSEFIAEVSSAIIRGPHGEVLGYLGITHDITAIVEADAKVRESEERLREAAEAAGFGVYRYDLVANTVFYSTEFLALYGLPAGATIEQGPDMVPKAVHPDDKAIFLAASKQSSDPAGSGIFDIEFRIILADGQVRWLRARGRTVFDGDGASRRPVRANGIIQDISMRKRAEQELGVQRTQLAHVSRVASMGQLASSLAHELNQPLGAILRNAEAAELLLQGPSPDLDELRAILADIRSDDQRAGGVIDRMRDLIKRREVKKMPLDVGALASDVIALARPEADMRRVQLVLEVDPTLPVVQGDRVQLQQVVLNLLLNALDALRDSRPVKGLVTVGCRAIEGGVEMSVSDNGRGIPIDRLSRIFEPFYTSKPDGMGMGLAISKTIIEAHGGRLWVENNTADAGATFRFSLPVAKGDSVGGIQKRAGKVSK